MYIVLSVLEVLVSQFTVLGCDMTDRYNQKSSGDTDAGEDFRNSVIVILIPFNKNYLNSIKCPTGNSKHPVKPCQFVWT